MRADPDLRERWRELAGSNKDCILIFLQQATPTEFEIEIDSLLTQEHLLTPADLRYENAVER